VGIKVRKGDNLSKLLQDAFSLKKLVLVECPIDYSDNYETFSKDLTTFQCDS
jgi:acetolactate synthase I/II/III large subunit